MLKITIAVLVILGLDLSWWWLIAVFASQLVDVSFSGQAASSRNHSFAYILAKLNDLKTGINTVSEKVDRNWKGKD